MADDEPIKSMPFIKGLASSTGKQRTTSLSALRTFLSRKRTSATNLTQLDALKLWKGLFFALWMCDRPIPQQNLCDNLSGLHLLLPALSIPIWWRAFWMVMASSWTTGIDVLRLNKFLLLVRRVLRAMFSWPRDQMKWGQDSSEEVIAILKEYPFEPSGDLRKIPVGLRLHVLDIWVEELEAAGLLVECQGDDKNATEFVASIVGAVAELQACGCKSLREKAQDSIKDERLILKHKDTASDNDPQNGSDEEGWDGFDD